MKEIKACKWTNCGDEVLVVRCMSKDGKTSSKRLVNGVAVESELFQNPLIVGETVTAPDWSDKAECGGGIHGWPWALSLGEGKECDWSGLWQVYGVKPSDIVDLEGKCKFRTGILRFSGDWQAATNFVLSGKIAFIHESDSGASSATGYSGASSATGYRGASSATGKCSAAVATGLDSKVMGGEFGCIALGWLNKKKNRAEMRCALTGSGNGSLKANVWYELDEKGDFREVKL